LGTEILGGSLGGNYPTYLIEVDTPKPKSPQSNRGALKSLEVLFVGFIFYKNLIKYKFLQSNWGEFKNHYMENFEPLYFIKGENKKAPRIIGGL
jgi:hypothetical protein